MTEDRVYSAGHKNSRPGSDEVKQVLKMIFTLRPIKRAFLESTEIFIDIASRSINIFVPGNKDILEDIDYFRPIDGEYSYSRKPSCQKLDSIEIKFRVSGKVWALKIMDNDYAT